MNYRSKYYFFSEYAQINFNDNSYSDFESARTAALQHFDVCESTGINKAKEVLKNMCKFIMCEKKCLGLTVLMIGKESIENSLTEMSAKNYQSVNNGEIKLRQNQTKKKPLP